MTDEFNNTAAIRSGEELPVDRLAKFLEGRVPNTGGLFVVEQFPEGHSNLTYLLRWPARELVLRRPPFGNQVKSAHDMGREFRVLSRLSPVFTAAPRPVVFCDDESVIGAPFYVMERRPGVILRKKLPPGITIDCETARQLSTAFIDRLAILHALDFKAAGLGDLGKPEGYVERQVTGWANRFSQAKTHEEPAIERVARWLSEHMPSESGAAVIHNDFKYDNLLLDANDLTRIVAVLDWEMATVGDPLMDLGTALGYWVEATDPEGLRLAAMGPTALPGSLARRELVARYEEQTGRAVSNALFYYCFGLFKIAVIVQQIYSRFVRGNTGDRRFAQLDQLVGVLGRQADRALERDSL